MLAALGYGTPVSLETMGGASFLSFDAPGLTEEDLAYLSMHSALSFMAEKEGDLLRPLPRPDVFVLSEDLPEVLKYKGKTSPSFTCCMINVALSLTPFFRDREHITVLDPICGKGTTAFCALRWGMNAIGVDLDAKDLNEASVYFSRNLKLHGLKHTVQNRSETVGKTAVPATLYTFAADKAAWDRGDTRSLRLYKADTALTGSLTRKNRAHLIVADLPYGVQHAPQAGQKPESFIGMLSRVLPAWKDALLKDGAIAVSFNTLTLPRQRLVEKMTEAGFEVCDGPLYTGFRHEVEQAVVRDVVFAVKR